MEAGWTEWPPHLGFGARHEGLRHPKTSEMEGGRLP